MFASQVKAVRPDNLAEMRITEDVPTELSQCSASFNEMIARLDEGFTAQRQFMGNARAEAALAPLALMQAQMELFCAERARIRRQIQPCCSACCKNKPSECLR